MAEKAMSLSTVSNSYKQKSKKLKVKERNKRYIMLVIVGAIFITILSIILWAIFKNNNSSQQ